MASITQWREKQIEAVHTDVDAQLEAIPATQPPPSEANASAGSCSPENEFKDAAIEPEVSE